MASNTKFSSNSREQRWVDQISKKFIREVTIDISDENPICVFNVPKSITIFKPDAYIPEVIALGPYHHMDPRLYHMERYKISSAKSFFNQIHPQQGNIRFQELLINRLKEMDPIVRGCYHSYVDLDDNTLSWIMAIDGLFLLNLLQDYVHLDGKKMQARDSILCRDLMLFENQIPFVLLAEISKIIKYNSSEKDEGRAELLFMMESFCRANSPLKVASIASYSYHATSNLHLLDLMYHLIVNSGPSDTEGSPQYEEEVEIDDESEELKVIGEDMNTICYNIGEITKVGMKFGIGRKILSPIQVIQDMPWDKISTIFGLKTKDVGKHEGPVVEEIIIPSVSSLHYYAGITFRSTSGGIRDTKFVKEEATLYLPIITLDVNSEAILRNLVAYEIAMNYSHYGHSFSEFMDLISGIIEDVEDVRLLKQMGIIEGGLTNNQIVKLFNGMNKSTKNSSNKTVSRINKYYKKKVVVKVFKFMKKRVFSSWKLITSLSTVLLLVLLVLYSFCEFYGCSKVFGRDN